MLVIHLDMEVNWKQLQGAIWATAAGLFSSGGVALASAVLCVWAQTAKTSVQCAKLFWWTC